MANPEPSNTNFKARPPVRRHDIFEFQELKVPRPFQGFINFIREQGVVGLGVGFVVGTSASSLVKSIVTNLFNPLVGVLMGGNDLDKKAVCLQSGAKACSNPLNYGQVVSDLITFTLVLFLVYLLIKGMKLEKVDKQIKK
jgi:large conductance mechanosensitive channel